MNDLIRRQREKANEEMHRVLSERDALRDIVYRTLWSKCCASPST